jgi:hypothetical protein
MQRTADVAARLTLFNFRLRDATGFYACSLPTVRSICSGTDWSRRLQSATRSDGCLMKPYTILTLPTPVPPLPDSRQW